MSDDNFGPNNLMRVNWWNKDNKYNLHSYKSRKHHQTANIFSSFNFMLYAIKVWVNVFQFHLPKTLKFFKFSKCFGSFFKYSCFCFSMRKEALWNWLQPPLIQFKSDIYEDSLSSNRKVWKNPTMKNASWTPKGTYPCKLKTALFVHRKRIKK